MHQPSQVTLPPARQQDRQQDRHAVGLDCDPSRDRPRLRLFRDPDPVSPGSDVPDPYYGGDAGFEEVLRMVERTTGALVAALLQQRPRTGESRPGPDDRPGLS